MEEIDIEIKILDYLQGRLSGTERKEVEHLQQISPAFAAKFSEVKQVWEGLDLREVPDISAEPTTGFEAMLKTFELEQEHRKTHTVWRQLAALFVYRPKYNWAYSVLLISMGALGAWLYLKPADTPVPNDPQQTSVLAMLKNADANGRLKAVNYTQRLRQVNSKVIDALFLTLNTDPNENVRLVTLDALVQLADDPKVRAGLVNAIIKQDSELVQAALADAMLQLQEKKSVKSFKKLLEERKSPIIQKKLEQTVQQLETI
ncbi:HEAT repeat domain-containing protein [Mucilaginibacter sp.]|jgi:hypothetical protein|uniref:HEAT repeat domain-containing protein n=1 Tax=Mucilaginibacter sp. TaxID=1882438 RepID=UPI00356920D9